MKLDWRIGSLPIALALLALGFAPVGASASTDEVKRFAPVKKSPRALVFKPKPHGPLEVRRSRLKLKGHPNKNVRKSKVTTAIRAGRKLRLRKPASARHGVLQVRIKRPDSTPPSPMPAPSRCTLADLDPGERPDACWRPFAADSPFNRGLGSNPRTRSGSASMVSRWADFGNISAPKWDVGYAGTEWDYSHPVYYSKPSDPVFTVRCIESWGRCAVEGEQVRIPDRALPAAGSDGHMAVIDPRTGWEHDFWQVRSKPKGGGVLKVSWGGKARHDGDGRGSQATAAEFPLSAGIVRASEMRAGRIDHALFMVVKCTNGTAVYPAADNSGRSCSSIGEPNAGAPPLGAHFFLDMTPAQIAGLSVPAWQKTILRALAEYGAFVGDTGGGFIKVESGTSYRSFGEEDPWVSFAKSVGAGSWFNPELGVVGRIFDMRKTIDWRNRMRVAEPCVSRGSC